MKMSKDSSATCFQNNKKRPQKKSREKYWSLSEQEKDKNQQYGDEQYKNFSEDKSKS